jgi:hypothetical protein
VLVVIVGFIVASMRAASPALPPVCPSIAGLFDSFGSIKFDSASNRFRFTSTTFHPRGAAPGQAQFVEKPQSTTEDTCIVD